MKVLYVVSINTTTSVPLEAAGKIEELALEHGIQFSVATYYRQPNITLKAAGGKNLIELNFKHSYSITTVKNYYNLIKSVNPDILHLHHGVSAFQGAILAKITGVKAVIKTEHNDHKFYKWYQKVLTVPVFILSRRIICNSKNTLLSFYPWEKWIARNKSKFIYNGINLDKISSYNTSFNTAAIREKYGLASGDRLFVSVGRLIEQKNYENLINGFEELYKTNKTSKLIIVGGGPQEKKLLNLVKQKGLSGNINIIGMVQRDEVYRIVNASDFFIIASRWEGFCNAVAEAMAAGKPVISSNISTLREVIGEQCGVFFNYSSYSDIARAIREILAMPQNVIDSMGSSSKNRAINNFTIEASARSYLQEYLTLAI